jgi:hypothetical protein
MQALLARLRPRHEQIQRAAHVERGDRHHRADREPQQPVLAEGVRVEAARQHHRQQELHRLVEHLDRAEG